MTDKNFGRLGDKIAEAIANYLLSGDKGYLQDLTKDEYESAVKAIGKWAGDFAFW
jgi:hypothetical protein